MRRTHDEQPSLSDHPALLPHPHASGWQTRPKKPQAGFNQMMQRSASRPGTVSGST